MEGIFGLRLPRVAFVAVALVVLPGIDVTWGGVDPLWQELGGSASGDGLSKAANPRRALEARVAASGDGRPVVVYTEYPDLDAEQGAITVKRWTGSSWELLSGPAGIAVGYEPQVRVAADGAVYVAWLRDDAVGNTEIHLRVRTTGPGFDELGGSDSPGGIAGPNAGVAAPYSLALDAAGRPIVAFQGVAQTGIVDAPAIPAIVDGTTQVYVRRWTGRAWEFVGSGFTGGGASHAVSFAGATGPVLHGADTPSIAVDSSNAPLVAFAYYTTLDGRPVGNADVFVTRWNGSAWAALGPSVPDGDTPAGRGGAAGVSNSASGSFNPSLAAGPAGRLALAWEEHQPTGETYVRVRVWNGASWTELGGSATGSGFNQPGTTNLLPSIALGADGRPIVAWEGFTDASPSQIFVRRWNGTSTWDEIGLQSARDGGISAAAIAAFGPSMALTPDGVAGAPTVAWLDLRDGADGQVFLRQLSTTRGLLTVRVTGGGTVTSAPAGVQCASESCVTALPEGIAVSLAPPAAPGWTFTGWSGDCSGVDPCMLSLTEPRSVSATFTVAWRLTLTVTTPAGTGGQGAVGTIDGPGGSCPFGGGSACTVDVLSGTPVVLQASPAPGNRFLSWSGGPCNGRTAVTCSFSVTSANVSTSALFRGVTAVSVGKAGNGAGTITGNGISCGVDCAESIFTGSVVTLTPAPATGSTFAGWTGDACSTVSATGACRFTASGLTRSFTATFQLKKQRLAVTTAGAGGGFVSSNPAGVDCGGAGHAACGADYDYGTSVLLTPVPAVDSRLSAWAGCSGVSGSLCTIVMTANRVVTGTFVPARTLTVSASGNGSGRIVSPTPPGLTCVNSCSVSQLFSLNASVALFPQPSVGTTFRWTGGDCSGSGACTSVMSVNRSAAGQFTLNRHSLSVTAAASGKVVNAAPLPGGVAINCGSGGGDCGGTFDYGTAVSLQATANPGFVFVSWTGTACPGSTSASCLLTLKANTTATPNFRARTLVTVVKDGTGAGTVSGPGISCGVDCSQPEFDSRPVLLTAAAAAGSRFLGFGGACVSSVSTCSFVPAGDSQDVSATFQITQRRLAIGVVGSGTVDGPAVSTCDGSVTPCTQDVDYGTPLVLTATAAPGHRFTGWSQDCAGVGLCRPVMTANHSVTATFRPEFTLAVTKPGNSTGTVTSSPAGISCGADCGEPYLGGTVVTLTRSAPAAGTTFRWGGDCADRGANATCTRAMNANATVEADYSLEQLALTVVNVEPSLGRVTRAGGGIDCGTDCEDVVDHGTDVVLTAVPATSPAAEFVAWAGCTTVANTSCSVKMTTTRIVTATFRPLVQSVSVHALSSATLAMGAVRQLAATATFSDGSLRDVTTQATWTSSAPGVASVNSTGLVTGKAMGSSSLTATFRGQSDALTVDVDALVSTPGVAPIVVSCHPYGDTSPDASLLACLPSGLNFSVLCEATATFTSGTQDVTDQVTWLTSNAAIAQSTGLVAFDTPIRQSFRIVGNGTAVLRATLAGKTSATTGTLGDNAWLVQGVAAEVTGIQVTPDLDTVAVGADRALRATATLATAAPGCASPSTRDFSTIVTWQSSNENVATVSFFGAVHGVQAGGPVSITATYPAIGTPLADSAVITVVP